jgi:hypothetical protein
MLAFVGGKVLLLFPLLLRLRSDLHLGLRFRFLLFQKLYFTLTFRFDLQHLFEFGVRVHVRVLFSVLAVGAFGSFLFAFAAEFDLQGWNFSLFAGRLFSFAFLRRRFCR